MLCSLRGSYSKMTSLQKMQEFIINNGTKYVLRVKELDVDILDLIYPDLACLGGALGGLLVVGQVEGL